MAKQELFSNPLISTYLKHILAFPVDRDRLGIKTVKHARHLLASGQIIGMFPTGTRSTMATSPKAGVARLAVMTGAPIVPATVTAVRYSGMRRQWRPRYPVSFG